MRANCFPFLRIGLADIDNETGGYCAREKKISDAGWTPSLQSRPPIEFYQARKMRRFTHEQRSMRMIRMRIVPELCKNNARAQPAQHAYQLDSRFFGLTDLRIAEVEIFAYAQP